MKKFITAAALLAAGTALANAATLLGSWDFSTATETAGTIASTSGNLSLSVGNGLASLSEGKLVIDKTDTATTRPTIDLSSADFSLADGLTVKMTVSSFSRGNNGSCLFAVASENSDFLAAMGVRNQSSTRPMVWVGGSSNNAALTEAGDYSWVADKEITFIIDGANMTMGIYQGTDEIATATINAGLASAMTQKLTSLALGGYVGSSSNGIPSMSVNSLSIYKGVAAIPEPSAFGLLAGAGALALVAARRRRKA